MRYFLLINVLVFTFFLTAMQTAAQVTVADDEENPYLLLCGEADKAIADGDYERAVRRLQDAMTVNPDAPSNILLKANLGMVYSYMGKDSMALSVYDEALQEVPDMEMMLMSRGMTLLRLGRDKKAYKDFQRLIELDSLNTDARYYHGIIALYSGDSETAEKDFNILKSSEPESTMTAIALSSLYSLTRRDREAIPYYKKLLLADPSAEYYAALAGCYLAIENLSEASATISQGLAKYPDDPELYYYRAWLNKERFLLDDAKADAQKAVKLGASPLKVKALFKKGN